MWGAGERKRNTQLWAWVLCLFCKPAQAWCKLTETYFKTIIIFKDSIVYSRLPSNLTIGLKSDCLIIRHHKFNSASWVCHNPRAWSPFYRRDHFSFCIQQCWATMYREQCKMGSSALMQRFISLILPVLSAESYFLIVEAILSSHCDTPRSGSNKKSIYIVLLASRSWRREISRQSNEG